MVRDYHKFINNSNEKIRDIIDDELTVKVNQMVLWFTIAEVSHFR